MAKTSNAILSWDEVKMEGRSGSTPDSKGEGKHEHPMVRKILVVDDDQEMLLSLREGLQKYSETFSVFLARDGQVATERLKDTAFSLVVTDLKMPKMDGFSLLAHIMEHYPEVPVIIMTAYSTQEMQRIARRGGTVGYIEKPFMIDDLAVQIMATLKRESDGGTLHGVSSGMFLQLIEMEQKTCTIRLSDKASAKQGVLFFKDGELIDARVNGLQGVSAAYEIFSWDEVSLSIQNECFQKERRIRGELQAILIEATRRKDERLFENTYGDHDIEIQQADETFALQGQDTEDVLEDDWEPEETYFIHDIRTRIETEVGEGSGLVDVYRDPSWDSLIAQMGRIGSFFGAGTLKLGYIDKGNQNNVIIMPGSETLVVSVRSRCPRDRIIDALVR